MMSKIDVANFSDVQARTEERMFVASKSILIELANTDSHANRVRMANAIISGAPGKFVLQMAKFVLTNAQIGAALDSFLAANPTLTLEQGYLRPDVVTDNAIDMEIAGQWTTLANANYGS